MSLGATAAATPRELAAASDVVVVCVSDTPDVEAVLFGPDGVADGLRVRWLGHRLLHHLAGRDPGVRARASPSEGVAMVDAPVSGGSEGAQKGTLTIMVGGDEADVERARPVLAAMGKTITHMGPIGAGQSTKAVNQVILAGNYLGVAEGMVLAIKSGLDPEKVVAALSGGAARSWVLENRSGRMIDGRLPAGLPDRAPSQGPDHRPGAGARGRRGAPRGRAGIADRGGPGGTGPRG